jgi:hypothetical protein
VSLFAVLHLPQVVDDPGEGPASLGAQLADAADQCGEVGVTQLGEQLVFVVGEGGMGVVEQVGRPRP